MATEFQNHRGRCIQNSLLIPHCFSTLNIFHWYYLEKVFRAL
jgi:hypothetical protein